MNEDEGTEETKYSDPDVGEDDQDPDLASPRLYGVPVTESHGQVVLHTDKNGYNDLVGALVDDGFGVCIDLCGADYLGNETRVLPEEVAPERFEVVVNLLDIDAVRRIRIRAQVDESDPELISITPFYPGAEAMEREAIDMFGLQFQGHPDPTPILLPDDWEGHPLRKDFAIGRIPVQFKAVEGR
ncbi:MAG TPA: NADH-quinone oxidoreductase subunit C [Acidimicrobiaceae bacterium]|nr:NADH-quinone oxidoreductase subunit C [Acidimicrobiaceae bacterium]